jgi:hypothetical protein
MKVREKRTRTSRATKHVEAKTHEAKHEDAGSGVFDVPSHGRLARRGSTEVIDEDSEPGGRGSMRERAHDASS